MTITELLTELRGLFGNERDKGTAFEKLIKMFLETEPKYMQTLSNVWMWKDFPYRENIGDIGIDLVAKTFTDEYWAIQCKFYEEEHTITKDDVDSFLAASSKTFDVSGKTVTEAEDVVNNYFADYDSAVFTLSANGQTFTATGKDLCVNNRSL